MSLKKIICLLAAISVFAFMSYTITKTSLQEDLFNLPAALTSDPWFLATCVDAYLALFLFYIWVFFKEHHWLWRLFWFVMIMGLGNIGTGAYLMIAIIKVSEPFSVKKLIFNQPLPKKR
jgi:hypothetical protein